MDSFYAGNAVKLNVPLQDADGNLLAVESVMYRVVDENAVEKMPWTSVDAFVAGAAQVTIGVLSTANELDTGVVRGLRHIEIKCYLADENVQLITAAYILETNTPLVVGVNSFMTLPMAEFLATSMPNLNGWGAPGVASPQRVAALIDARDHILQLSFSALTDSWGQDSLHYIPEGTYDSGSTLGSWSSLFNGDLSLLTPDQFMKLPPEFLAALNKAQLAEADIILGGDSAEQKRQDGLTSDVIGESRQTFRAGKPLRLPVSRRALAYLSGYVSYSLRIGRA